MCANINGWFFAKVSLILWSYLLCIPGNCFYCVNEWSIAMMKSSDIQAVWETLNAWIIINKVPSEFVQVFVQVIDVQCGFRNYHYTCISKSRVCTKGKNTHLGSHLPEKQLTLENDCFVKQVNFVEVKMAETTWKTVQGNRRRVSTVDYLTKIRNCILFSRLCIGLFCLFAWHVTSVHRFLDQEVLRSVYVTHVHWGAIFCLRFDFVTSTEWHLLPQNP